MRVGEVKVATSRVTVVAAVAVVVDLPRARTARSNSRVTLLE